MEALGINLGYLLVQICMFGITFVVLRAWVYKPVLGLLARRREAIAQGLEDARVAAEARANAEKEASQILSEAQAKAAQMIREATERAEGAAREVRASADVEAGKARESALQEVEQERTRMLGELRGQVATLAIAAAQRIISDALDEQRQRALLDEFFSGLHSGKVVVLDGEDLSQGANAEVTSALPLTDKEQESKRQKF